MPAPLKAAPLKAAIRSPFLWIGVLLWVATRRADLLRGYAYPRWLLGIGWTAWLLTLYLAVRSVRPVIELFS